MHARPLKRDISHAPGSLLGAIQAAHKNEASPIV